MIIIYKTHTNTADCRCLGYVYCFVTVEFSIPSRERYFAVHYYAHNGCGSHPTRHQVNIGSLFCETKAAIIRNLTTSTIFIMILSLHHLSFYLFLFIQISARREAPVTEVFRDYSQSLKANSGIVPLSFTFFPIHYY